MQQQLDYVLRTVEERGVRFVRMWFTDVLGQLKSFAITPAELENALEDGMTFDGSSIDGFSRVQEADVLAMFAAVDAGLGRLTALVNNAGVVDVAARVDEMSVERLERMWRINLTGSFLCAREALRRLNAEIEAEGPAWWRAYQHGGGGGKAKGKQAKASNN